MSRFEIQFTKTLEGVNNTDAEYVAGEVYMDFVPCIDVKTLKTYIEVSGDTVQHVLDHIYEHTEILGESSYDVRNFLYAVTHYTLDDEIRERITCVPTSIFTNMYDRYLWTLKIKRL